MLTISFARDLATGTGEAIRTVSDVTIRPHFFCGHDSSRADFIHLETLATNQSKKPHAGAVKLQEERE
jgi:hypothetical protein